MGDYLSDLLFASVAPKLFLSYRKAGYNSKNATGRKADWVNFRHDAASLLKSSSQFRPFVGEKVGSGFSSCFPASHLKDDIM
ncbi:hypothetical protein SAMN05880561_105183 [Rhizobium sp. RU33A]|nr:hypothetical protein SAMN05880561_105183 [Rhizobium sp. RU33A]